MGRVGAIISYASKSSITHAPDCKLKAYKRRDKKAFDRAGGVVSNLIQRAGGAHDARWSHFTMQFETRQDHPAEIITRFDLLGMYQPQ